MKKILAGLFIICCLLLSGCGKMSASDVGEKFSQKVKSLKSYYLEATMTLTNNDDNYNYDVKINYLKNDNYRVELINKSNNYEQIILKNEDGVFVITPALNKSFKFQSEWPYNNSQAYLLQSLKDDIEKSKDLELVQKDNDLVLTTEVRYPNNSKLVKQNLTFDQEINLKRVEVKDENDITHILVEITKTEENVPLSNDFFKLDNNIIPDDNQTDENNSQTTKLDESIFPLYIPLNTSLSSKETITKNNGERIIMTFSGDKPFLLVEENASKESEHAIIPTTGEPYLLIDTIGVLTDDSIAWTSNGIEYYIISDVMSTEELLEIAKSMNTLPTMK